MSDPDNDEGRLVEAAKKDREAFGELYERYADRIYSYLYYRTGHVREAEDMTARVFVRAVQHIDNYEDRGAPFSAWLYRIARNMLSNWYRDRSKRRWISLDNVTESVVSEGPERYSQETQDREALLAAIRRLPPDRQELLILKFVEQHSNAEIGEIMGRSEGAIKALYHRTLLALRAQMNESGPEVS